MTAADAKLAEARAILAAGVPAALRALEDIAVHGRTVSDRAKARRALAARPELNRKAPLAS